MCGSQLVVLLPELQKFLILQPFMKTCIEYWFCNVPMDVRLMSECRFTGYIDDLMSSLVIYSVIYVIRKRHFFYCRKFFCF